MKQIMLREGKSVVCDVPAPVVGAGTILVDVEFSCISAGTEMMGLKSSGQSLLQKALDQPKHVKKGIEMISRQGLSYTRNFINSKIGVDSPVGYSVAGTVREVGPAVRGFSVGDRVACAGAQCAFHSQVVNVPANLAVVVPKDLSVKYASTVALGAIALQGVRRLKPTLGETFAVIGLGILGQLTCQMLVANGCTVIGCDIKQDRLELAKALGTQFTMPADEQKPIEFVQRLTDGYGVDGVIITAAAQSNDIIATAFQMCRKKGRVVLVGDVGLELNRHDIYEKELDFFISTSYGPGRYDTNYEEKGQDYPLPWVRWTENRNMREYLRLLVNGQIQIESLISKVFDFTKIDEAYHLIEQDELKSPLLLLEFGPQKSERRERLLSSVVLNGIKPSARLNIAVVGMGEFARTVHLPNIKALSEHFQLHTVVSRRGHDAVNMARLHNALHSSSDYEAVLQDKEIHCILLATRHNVHGSMALAALQAGKHVLVEKPLALTTTELNAITEFYAGENNDTPAPLLLTGFNRRFSPYMQVVKKHITARKNPMLINYRMNAGYISKDHWVQTEEGGGRNRGEACHIYDLFTFLTESQVVSIDAKSIQPQMDYYLSNDNFNVHMSFADGSVATLTYTAMGDSSWPKEHMEIFYDGKVITMTDYLTLEIHGMHFNKMRSKHADKGHAEEVRLFGESIKKRQEWPIPLWQQVQATEIALTVEELLRNNMNEV
ncbi:MAG: oxidoreductase [Calditrichaeota bacterium]|nr:MAG: oxidoreductase [Calditrichota bacterium]